MDEFIKSFKLVNKDIETLRRFVEEDDCCYKFFVEKDHKNSCNDYYNSLRQLGLRGFLDMEVSSANQLYGRKFVVSNRIEFVLRDYFNQQTEAK